MEVHKLQYSPQFTSLKINKGAEEKLNELPMETIDKIKEAGKILGKEGDENATKFYHVEIDEDLNCAITADKDAYFGLFETDEYKTRHGIEKSNGKNVRSDRVIMIENKKGRTICGVARYVPYLATEPFFNAWGSYGCSYKNIGYIDQLAKVAKILDTVAAEKHYAKIADSKAKNADQEKVSKDVKSLLRDFGI